MERRGVTLLLFTSHRSPGVGLRTTFALGPYRHNYTAFRHNQRPIFITLGPTHSQRGI